MHYEHSLDNASGRNPDILSFPSISTTGKAKKPRFLRLSINSGFSLMFLSSNSMFMFFKKTFSHFTLNAVIFSENCYFVCHNNPRLIKISTFFSIKQAEKKAIV